MNKSHSIIKINKDVPLIVNVVLLPMTVINNQRFQPILKSEVNKWIIGRAKKRHDT